VIAGPDSLQECRDAGHYAFSSRLRDTNLLQKARAVTTVYSRPKSPTALCRQHQRDTRFKKINFVLLATIFVIQTCRRRPADRHAVERRRKPVFKINAHDGILTDGTVLRKLFT